MQDLAPEGRSTTPNEIPSTVEGPELEAMPGAVDHVLQAVGQTPLIRLNHVTRGLASEIFVKLEYLNPAGSMKDRVAISIIDEAERTGALKPGGTIIEATSGNTGAGLAMVAAVRGYKCIFVMPDKMSAEKVSALKAYGARVVLCPTAVEPEDPRSYYCVSRRLVEETPGAFYANQYHNPANPAAHYALTGPEIWAQSQGRFHSFVAGMGTGGSISGCGRYFREQNPAIKLIGVDPIGSIYHEYVKRGRMTKAFAYQIEGIGEDFLPSTMDLEQLSDCVQVDDGECFNMTRELVRKEGLFVGGSSGAAVLGALKYARTLKTPERIIVLLPDGAPKYMSKIFNDDWMRDNGYALPSAETATVAQLLKQRAQTLFTVREDTSVQDTIALMKAEQISQVPVLDGQGRHCGVVTEIDLLNHLVDRGGQLKGSVSELVSSDYATVSSQTRVELLRKIFNTTASVLVVDQERLVGLLTKIDLIDYLSSSQTSA